jgi:crotonobetainyl-CoA:carnitine CoA-transferase CaiB-like acyl-CoA transferase
VKFSETPGSIRGPAPLYGEHTRAVLLELGYDDAALRRMATSGAIHMAESV